MGHHSVPAPLPSSPEVRLAPEGLAKFAESEYFSEQTKVQMTRNVIEEAKERAVELAAEYTDDELIVITVENKVAKLDFYERMVKGYNVDPDNLIEVLAHNIAGDNTSYDRDHPPREYETA